MFNPFHRSVPTCPACQFPLRLFRGGCAHCRAPLYIPSSYFRWVWLLVLAVLTALAIPTYTSEHAGTWFLELLLIALPVRLICGVLVPPPFECGQQRSKLPFVAWYVACCLMIFVYWTGFGWTHILLGASKDELRDNLNFFSLPLGMVSRGFVLAPQRTFVDVCGILLANCFFYARVLFLLHKFGAFLIRRNRVTRMDLSALSSPSEYEED